MTALRHPPIVTGSPPMVGVCLTKAEFQDYVQSVPIPLVPRISGIVLHHTVEPTPQDWSGLRSMRGMQTYYRRKGWTSAPHIYVAPDGIWMFTPLHMIGIHANAGNGSTKAGWYTIGVEMVGRYDAARPDGTIWDLTRFVLGTLCRRFHLDPDRDIDPHRQYNTDKTCPGSAVKMEWVANEVKLFLQHEFTAPPPARVYTPQSFIIAPPGIASVQAERYMTARPMGEYVPIDLHDHILPEYFRVCIPVGVDPAVAIAQMIHETGNLTSDWAARPHRNPAGIGVTGVKGEGLSFVSWERPKDPTKVGSVEAHIGRLLAYALPLDQRNQLQSALIYRAMSVRPLPAKVHGSAPDLLRLGAAHNPSGQGWADPGDDYGEALAGIANALVAQAK